MVFAFVSSISFVPLEKGPFHLAPNIVFRTGLLWGPCGMIQMKESSVCNKIFASNHFSREWIKWKNCFLMMLWLEESELYQRAPNSCFFSGFLYLSFYLNSKFFSEFFSTILGCQTWQISLCHHFLCSMSFRIFTENVITPIVNLKHHFSLYSLLWKWSLKHFYLGKWKYLTCFSISL